ncbi:MAG: class I SAM-dependent methyltransferase [bacterium]
MSVEQRFGYEWEKYRELDPYYESQFQQWLGPITPDFIRGRRVLDAGSGMGRNSYWCAKWGAADIVAFDNDDRTIQAARSLLGEFPNVRVEKRSIYDIPYENEFDFVFSAGVIQFLENPGCAVINLIRALKPGGTLLLWVYAREGNERFLRLVDPVRKHVTSKLPPPVLDWLTYLVSIPFFGYVKIFRPRGAYFRQLRDFRFRHIHLIIFDHLLPPVARYYTREEALALIHGLENPACHFVNQNSWTVIGQKPLIP